MNKRNVLVLKLTNFVVNIFLFFQQEPWLKEMKHNLVCQTPPTVIVHVKSSASRSHQQKKLARLKRPAFKDRQENCEKGVPSQKYKCPKGPCLVIQRQEMTAFFKLFGRLIM